MPKVMRVAGLRVVIYPNDHPPPHVHVIGAKGEAVYFLNCPEGPARLRESYRFIGSELRRIETGLHVHSLVLCREWETIRGNL